MGVLLKVGEVESLEEGVPGGTTGEGFGAGGVRRVSDEVEVAREEDDWTESGVCAKEEGERC